MATALPYPFGCKHYQRNCKFLTPCCGKIYTCRICHDEQESHTLDRRAIRNVLCMVCGKPQRVRIKCKNCKGGFGKYCCLKCNLFDDEEKGQYHCDRCGVCRLGGADNFYHCGGCDMCLSIAAVGNHGCAETRWDTDCPVCIEDLRCSNQLYIPTCGHLMHETCFKKMEKAGYTICPVCKQAFRNKK